MVSIAEMTLILQIKSGPSAAAGPDPSLSSPIPGRDLLVRRLPSARGLG